MKDTSKDIIDVLIPPKVEDGEDNKEIENPETEYEEKHVPEHPYCTNWPVSKKEKNENI